MSRFSNYSGDPWWIKCSCAHKCSGCGALIEQGGEAYRYKTGELYGRACGCGEQHERDFCAAAADEAMYCGGY